MKETEVVLAYTRIPQSLISAELEGIYGSEVMAEMAELIKLYNIYDRGAEFIQDLGKIDYTPADLRYKQSTQLINKEARFLFSKTPDIWVTVPYDEDSETAKELASSQGNVYQGLIDNVLSKNQFSLKLLRAAKDCFIGKRVAYFINFSEERQRITVDFVPSLEFIYETDPEDTTILTKIVTFYVIKDSKNKTSQRIYKKKYWMQNNRCYIYEAVYDGAGSLVEELTPERATKFDYIPAGVIVNDGLTGDVSGESEIAQLQAYESWYSRIANADIDSERQGMNPIRWARDMDPESTKGLSISAGSFWDLSSDQNSATGATGEVGVLETSMGYTTAVDSTLGRLRSTMYEAVDVPDTSSEALKGVVSSGKTLKAIYWSLIVRCDEKMLAWRPAIRNIVKTILEGSRLYPSAAKSYQPLALPNIEYDIRVDNQYPIPEDEADEKMIDLQEVVAQTMSKKSYMQKWRNLTNKEAMDELQQIATERELLENAMGIMPPIGGE